MLKREEAAEYIRAKGYPISSATLASMATRGGGPPFVKFGRTALYEPDALDLWIEGRVVTHD